MSNKVFQQNLDDKKGDVYKRQDKVQALYRQNIGRMLYCGQIEGWAEI